jgi:hypothetical protein
VLSFEQERERIFVRWLSALEQLLDRHLDRDAAYEAWADGYSVAEYAATSLEAIRADQTPSKKSLRAKTLRKYRASTMGRASTT